MISLSFILHAFHAFRPRFWVFLKYMGVLKIDEYFVKFLGWVLCFWCYMLMHFITFAFSQCFMHYRCVFICWNLCTVRFGWGWTHAASLFLYVTCSCIIDAYIPFLFHMVLSIDAAFLFVSLSLSRYYAWHPSAKPLHLKSLFILGHLLLTLPPFTFGSMKRRLVRTSQRTFLDVVFIRGAI